MSKPLQGKIQKILARIIFPTTRRNWYFEKGFGVDGVDPFNDFLNQQTNNPDSVYYKEFKKLTIERTFITCLTTKYKPCSLDSICITPTDPQDKPGAGMHILNFFGRLEYYECNFRDMARQAHATGASIHAFNPPGMNSSTGQVLEFNDLVNAGIAQINALLKQGVHPDKIVLQGNCLGAAVAEQVNAHFETNMGIKFRRINSNSFRSISALITRVYPLLSNIKDKVKTLLEYTGWQAKPGALFQETDPYKVFMSRKHDQSIMSEAKLRHKVEKILAFQEKTSSQSKFYGEYDAHRQWLHQHSEMILDEDTYFRDKNTDPHELDLYKLKSDVDGCSAFDFINRYLEASNNYLEKHPQSVDSHLLQQGANYIEFQTNESVLQSLEELDSNIQKFIEITGIELDQHLTKPDDFENLFSSNINLP